VCGEFIGTGGVEGGGVGEGVLGGGDVDLESVV
jgi:hypothetical protein